MTTEESSRLAILVRHRKIDSMIAPKPQGPTANARRILRELVLVKLLELGGRARTSAVLEGVRYAAKGMVPAGWTRPYHPYRSKIELYAAFERATLRDQGLIDASERGFWILTPAGKDRAVKLRDAWKDGTAKPKLPAQKLVWNKGPNWLARLAGSMRDEPDFAEVLRLGRQIRRSERDS